MYGVFVIYKNSDSYICEFDTLEEAREAANFEALDPNTDVIYIDVNYGDDWIMIKH